MDVREALIILNTETPKRYKTLRKRWEDVYYSTSLHTDGACPKYKNLRGGGDIKPKNYFGEKYQEIFETRLFSRHPREDDATRQWRFSQYKPLTKSHFDQLTELVLGAIFQDSNYSITINNENDHKYILVDPSFNGYDLIGWFVSVGYGLMINDPNGYFIRMPRYPFNAASNDNPVIIDFVKSKDIIFVSETDFIFKKDDYAYHIDQTTIFRYKYDYQARQYYLAPEDKSGYYAHLLGRLPVSIAGGRWNSQGFFDSFYSKAIPVADEFISSYSAEQMIDKEASHPFIQQVMEECTNCNHTGSVHVPCDDCPGGVEMVGCPVCGGRGYTSVNPGDRLNVPAEQMDKDMVRIISPDTGINTYHHSKNLDLKNQILDELNLLKTDEAQSGVAKTIDQHKLHNFISKIANHILDNIIYSSIRDIIAYRNIVSIDGKVKPYEYDFTIIKPTQYQIKSSYDLLNDYKEAGAANIPIPARKQMYKEFMDKQYSGDPIIRKKCDLLDYYDVILVVPEQDRLSKLTTGEITRDELTLSLWLPRILDKLIIERGYEWFLKTPIRDFETIIETELAPYKKTNGIVQYTGEGQ